MGERKTFFDLVREERARRNAGSRERTADEVDIFGPSEEGGAAGAPAVDATDSLSWGEIVDFFYETRQRYPEAENCEVSLRRAAQTGYWIRLTFKNAFSDPLGIQVNDGKEMYAARIDARLSGLLGDRPSAVFEI